MSDVVIAAIVSGIPGIIASVLGFLNKGKLTAIHVAIDGRLDQLIRASKDSGIVQEQGEQAERDRK